MFEFFKRKKTTEEEKKGMPTAESIETGSGNTDIPIPEASDQTEEFQIPMHTLAGLPAFPEVPRQEDQINEARYEMPAGIPADLCLWESGGSKDDFVRVDTYKGPSDIDDYPITRMPNWTPKHGTKPEK